MVKRYFSILLAAAIGAAASGVCAQAAQEPEFDEDFSGYTAQNSIPNGFFNGNNIIHPVQADGSYRRMGPKAGVLGKASSDVSLVMETQINSTSLKNDAEGNPYAPQFSDNPYLGRNLTGKLNVGEAVHLSAELAELGSVSCRRNLYLSIYDKEGVRAHVFPFETTGSDIRAFGKKVKNVNMYTGLWYKIDILLYPDAGFELFINGKKAEVELGDGERTENGITYVKIPTVNNTNMTSFGYFDIFRVSMPTQGTDFSYGATAVDNLTLVNLTAAQAADLKNAMSPTYAEGNVMEDFSYIKANTAPGSGMSLGNYNATVANVVSFAPQKGLFGKAAEDVSLAVTNNSENMPEGVGVVGKPARWMRNPYLNIRAINDIRPGDTVRVGFNMAVKETQTPKFISARCNNTALQNNDRILQFTRDGQVTFLNKPVGMLLLQPEKWYNIEVLLKSGSEQNTADLYINGACMAKDQAFTVGKDGHVPLAKLDFLRLGYDFSDVPAENSAVGPDNEKLNYKPSGLYVDDIAYQVYRGAPAEIGQAVLSHSVPAVNQAILPAAGKILAGDELTAEELLDGLSEGLHAEVKDRAGNSVTTGVLKGNRVELRTGHPVLDGLEIGSSVIFYDTDLAPAVYTDSAFENQIEFRYGNNYPYPSNTLFNTAPGKCGSQERTVHVMKGQNGVGGRPQEDQSFVIDTAGFGTGIGEADPFLTFESPANLTQPFTVEASLLARGRDAEYRFDIMLNNDAGKSVMPLLLKQDGYLYSMGIKQGKWTENQWYRVACTIYPGTPYMDVYINGKQLFDKFDAAKMVGLETAEYYKRFKMLALYPKQEGDYNGLAAFDDFRLTEGVYTPPADLAQPEAVSQNYEISGGLAVIREEGALAMSVLGGFDRTDLRLYENNDFTKEYTFFEPVSTGNVLVCKSADSPVYRYYTVVVPSELDVPKLYVDGAAASEVKTGKLSAKAFVELAEGQTASLIVASYRNGRLEQIKMQPADQAGANLLTCELGMVDNAEGLSVKAMVWEGAGTARPLTGATVIQ